MTAPSRPVVDPDLAERLAFVAGSINRRLRPAAEALTHVALSALASIDRRGEVRPGDLARVEGIAAPGMTRLIADLEGRGLVARSPDPEDGRSQLIRLTDAGLAAVAAARHERASGVAEILRQVPPDELGTVQRAVAVLETALLTAAPTRARAV